MSLPPAPNYLAPNPPVQNYEPEEGTEVPESPADIPTAVPERLGQGTLPPAMSDMHNQVDEADAAKIPRLREVLYQVYSRDRDGENHTINLPA